MRLHRVHLLRSCLLRCALLVAVARAEEVFNTTPAAVKTSFSCLNRSMGFYADVEANCRAYHMCDDHGNQFSYRCPEETAFRQDAMICDHAHLVDCQATVYPTSTLPNENVDGNRAISPAKSPSATVDSLDARRPYLSRSFRVIQRPEEAAPNKLQSGFVFSASLFLRDQDKAREQSFRVRDTNSRSRATAQTLTERFYPWNDARDDKLANSLRRQPQSSSSSSSSSSFGSRAFDKSVTNSRRSFESTSSFSPAGRAVASNVIQRPPPPLPSLSPPYEKSHFDHGKDYRPYSETLRSIQANGARAISARTTTEIPVHALTLALKPLVPNELEYDPYYPRQPTSTEAYYTPSDRDGRLDARLFDTNRPAGAHLNLPFEIPSVLPDLNTLEDLVDRRKFFYIPRASVKSI